MLVTDCSLLNRKVLANLLDLQDLQYCSKADALKYS